MLQKPVCILLVTLDSADSCEWFDHLGAVVGGMADWSSVLASQLRHADKLHVVLNCIICSIQVVGVCSLSHCRVVEGVQSRKEHSDNLYKSIPHIGAAKQLLTVTLCIATACQHSIRCGAQLLLAVHMQVQNIDQSVMCWVFSLQSTQPLITRSAAVQETQFLPVPTCGEFQVRSQSWI